MKFLECPELLQFSNQFLHDFDLGDRTVSGLIEMYSCKKTVADRQLKRAMESKFAAESSMSPIYGADSPIGPMAQSSTRKLLAHLIATLNASFPDYDFSSATAEDFSREPDLGNVKARVNQLLLEHLDKVVQGVTARFWRTVDEVVELANCDVFRYNADEDSEVFSVGRLWSFNFFFYNRVQKKMLFFFCSAHSKLRSPKPLAGLRYRGALEGDDFSVDGPVLGLERRAGGAAGAAGARGRTRLRDADAAEGDEEEGEEEEEEEEEEEVERGGGVEVDGQGQRQGGEASSGPRRRRRRPRRDAPPSASSSSAGAASSSAAATASTSAARPAQRGDSPSSAMVDEDDEDAAERRRRSQMPPELRL